jgi:predicted RNA-binding Zn ribbon-like protein
VVLRNHSVFVDPFAPGRQPAGRTPAPGRLGLVQAFTNSFWDLDADGADEWAELAGYRAWLQARGFAGHRATAADRDRAIALRAAIRSLALRRDQEAARATLDRLAAAAPLLVRFDPQPRHEPAGDGPADALGLVLGVLAEAMADGTWERVKACPGPHCGWLFYDASRNRSSQWCSMRICGNRVKGREFRARARNERAGPGYGS